MARGVHDLKITDPVTFHERAQRHGGTDLRSVRRAGPDRSLWAPCRDFAEAANMVWVPMREDDVGDVTPACPDAVQCRLNSIDAFAWTRIDQQQPRRVGTMKQRTSIVNSTGPAIPAGMRSSWMTGST